MAKGQINGEGLSWQSRKCPDDFEIIFVELGRLECEPHYRARRTTVTRWLTECGKAKLLRRRADFVKYQRELRHSPRASECHSEIKDRRKVDPQLAAMAGRFLQSRPGGAWVVFPMECGAAFMVGTMRRSPAEVLAIAERKGFDRRRALEQIRVFAEPV